MKMHILVLFLVSLSGLTGCKTTNSSSDMSANINIKTPWCDTSEYTMGCTKTDILKDWGNPDQIIDRGEDRWGNSIEEWIYVGAYPDVYLPINYRYVKSSNHFLFHGNSVVQREINPIPPKTII